MDDKLATRKFNNERITRRLLAWYRQNGRSLPWRGCSNPYAVWVSEIMLQQTRVEAVIPYFEAWMQRFPTVEALAQASEQEVLTAWEGLGYYTRARNLHKAAKLVVEKHGGILPHKVETLRQLPGIGRYTANAIASFAFGLDEATLDGNLRRVLARLFDVSEAIDTPNGEKLLWNLAQELLPPGKAADFNQALMDLGTSICLPRRPRCLLCPLERLCQARAHGTQGQRPLRTPRKESPHYIQAAGIIVEQMDGLPHLLLAKRPSKGLLGGMWEFPNARVVGEPAEALEAALETAYRLRVVRGEAQGVFHHAYTHFRVTVHAFSCTLVESPTDERLKWVKLEEVEAYPMGKVDRAIAMKATGQL
ncbi:MAG: A/G-specific adenine glycosylase [Anaerolineales bacterium]